VIQIGVYPAREELDQHVVRVTSQVSCTTTVHEVPTKSKSGLCSRGEVLAPNDRDPTIILGCLILPPLNYLEAGRGWFDKVVTVLLGLSGSIKSDMRSVQIKTCPSGLK
jgi:hypothetical protein